MPTSENVLHHSQIERCPLCAAAELVVEAARKDAPNILRDALSEYDKATALSSAKEGE